MDQTKAEDLVRRLATALRASDLHSPTHPWERDGRGEHTRAVVEAVDPAPLGIDPMTYL